MTEMTVEHNGAKHTHMHLEMRPSITPDQATPDSKPGPMTRQA